MRARQEVPAAVHRLAEQQAGVVARWQALEGGLTRTVLTRLLADGRWARLDRGIYLVPNAPVTWLGRAWAAVLLGGHGARLTGAAAAVLNGLEQDLCAAAGENEVINRITTAVQRRLTTADALQAALDRRRIAR